MAVLELQCILIQLSNLGEQLENVKTPSMLKSLFAASLLPGVPTGLLSQIRQAYRFDNKTAHVGLNKQLAPHGAVDVWVVFNFPGK